MTIRESSTENNQSSDNNDSDSSPPPPPNDRSDNNPIDSTGTNATGITTTGTTSTATNSTAATGTGTNTTNSNQPQNIWLGFPGFNFFSTRPNYIGFTQQPLRPPPFNPTFSAPPQGRLNHPYIPYAQPHPPFLPIPEFRNTGNMPFPNHLPPNPHNNPRQQVDPDNTRVPSPIADENMGRVVRVGGPTRTLRKRRERSSPYQNDKQEKSETISPPYPWSTSKRCHFYTLGTLLEQNRITSIPGEVHCKKCGKTYTLTFDLKSKFTEVASYLVRNNDEFRHRAPDKWMKPILPTCILCNQKNAVKPIPSKEKKFINWLFLFLGEMLGCCKLTDLRYFCKHNQIHRTGAKDRLLYLVYVGICRQLCPTGPFEV